MADQSDIEDALVAAVTAALYPQGTAAPSRPGPACRIHRGWPVPAALQDDLAAGHVTVSVSAIDGSLRATTRFPEAWTVAQPATPALTATLDGTEILFAGSADPGQLAGVLADGATAVHRTEAGDTPEAIAATLAARLRATHMARAIGPVLSVPGAARLLARVVADQPALREIRRQVQSFRIACFCPSPATRDATAAAIDTALAATRFLPLPDGSAARLTFAGTTTLDAAREASLFRRDLVQAVEYATTQSETQTALLFGTASLNGAANIS